MPAEPTRKELVAALGELIAEYTELDQIYQQMAEKYHQHNARRVLARALRAYQRGQSACAKDK